MTKIEEGKLDGPCEGYQDFEFFRFLDTGNRWQQIEHFYQYSYSYMPIATIFESNGRFLLKLPGTSKTVEVKQA